MSLTETGIYSQKFDKTVVVRLPTSTQEILFVILAGAATSATPATHTTARWCGTLSHRHATWRAAGWRSVGGAAAAVVAATTASGASGTKATMK